VNSLWRTPALALALESFGMLSWSSQTIPIWFGHCQNLTKLQKTEENWLFFLKLAFGLTHVLEVR
jgi:hypothetical protein